MMVTQRVDQSSMIVETVGFLATRDTSWMMIGLPEK